VKIGEEKFSSVCKEEWGNRFRASEENWREITETGTGD
jgi:hypothetical protein